MSVRFETVDGFERWREANAPVLWRDVWIRSRRCRGRICASHQNSGNPSANTITVAITDPDGHWDYRSELITYDMDTARIDLLPDLWFLIQELP